ncbi:hypothetical protein [Sphingomonas asaccharolytica]|uniref:hypothetical protein n=1 Tax=Sphingomonas asaccharolytica TaxID=40681 RepID=UPI000AF5D050|nr:hypothetical protein [Sphingomonas asaccharolytica]
MNQTIFRHRGLATAATIALAAALSACGKGNDQQMTAAAPPALPATLPLDASPSTAWPTAPEVAALPEAKPVRTVRVANPRDTYGYANAAYDYQRVLSDAPPDYYFDYDGADPWAWEGYDQSVVFLEPVDNGYRSYYYRPGADEPYFVRDPYYGYGYDNGQLAVVYDSYGSVVPYSDYGARLDYAGRYLTRGRDLYLASRRADRRAVSAANWEARSAAISAAQARWYATRDRQPQWRDYSSRVGPSQANYWREEGIRRQADARRFAAWRDDSFRSPPPPRAIPATWSSASWARDQKRFLPARDDRVRLADAAQANRGAPNMPQGLFANRQRIEPGNRAPNAVAPQANDPRRQAIIAAREQQRPGAGPMRASREPQGNAPVGGFAPRPQGQPNPPRVASPRGNPDRAQLANMRGDHGMRGNAPGFRTQPQPRVTTPRAQSQIGRGGGRPQMPAPRPEPRAAAPRFQPQFNGGNDRPRFQAPRPQPQIAAPRPQAPRFGGGGDRGMRPAPQMNRPAFQPRPPQMARPAPQMARPAPQMARPAPQMARAAPRAAVPTAPRGGGENGHGGDHKH